MLRADALNKSFGALTVTRDVSLTVATGPLVLTDSMPLSRAASLLYISLLPMISPLIALRTKYG